MQSMLSSSLLNTAAGILSLLAGLGSSIVVARLLGVEGTGLVAYALWLMTIGAQLSGLGLAQTLLRFIGRGEGNGGGAGLVNALSYPFAVSTGLFAVAALVYAGVLWWLDRGGESLFWAANAALFLTYAYSTMALAAAEGLGRFRESTAYAAIGCLLQPFAVFFGGLLLGPAGAIFGNAVRHLPQALATRRYRAPEGTAPVTITPDMKAYARNSWLSAWVQALLTSRVELLVIGLFLTLADVGFYSVGITMSGMVIQLSLSLVATLVPYLGYHYDRGDTLALERVFNRSLLGLTVLLAPVAFGGAAIAPVLIPTMFGADFTPAITVTVILLAFAITYPVQLVPARLMLAAERSGQALWVMIVSGLGTVALLFAVVPFYGAQGAAWAKGASEVLLSLYYLYYCRYRLKVAIDLASFVKVMVAGGLCAIAAYLVVMAKPDLVGMIAAVMVGGIVYPVALIALGALPRDLRDYLHHWVGGALPGRVAGPLRWALAFGAGPQTGGDR